MKDIGTSMPQKEEQSKEVAKQEFKELVGSVFRQLKPEEQEEIDKSLPKSLRRGYRGKKAGS